MSAGSGVPGSAPLHMTIGTFIAFDETGAYSMAEEIRLAKVALLYADQALLFSPGVSMVSQLGDPEELSTREEREEWWLNYLVARILQNPSGDISRALPRLGAPDVGALAREPAADRRRVALAIREHLAPFLSSRVSDRALEEGTHDAWEYVRAAGIYELREAAGSGVLVVHGFEQDENMGWIDQSDHARDRRVAAYTNLVARTILDGTTHPLFDDQTGSIAGSLLRGGAVSPSEAKLRLGRHGALAADLLKRLPTFEDADVKRVLEVRRELSPHLSGFRGAVASFARETRGVAWDEDFPIEAEQMFIERVAPEVERIERAIESDSSLRSLAFKGFRPSEVSGGLGLSAGLSSLAGVSDLFAVAAGVVGAAGATIRNAFTERAVEREKLEGNRMFFYVAARDRLRS